MRKKLFVSLLVMIFSLVIVAGFVCAAGVEKVKIFSSYGAPYETLLYKSAYKGLDKSINDWLAKNPNITIINRDTQVTKTFNTEILITVTIFYKEGE